MTSSTSWARLAMYRSISARIPIGDVRPVQQEVAEPIAQRGAAGVAAGDDLAADRPEPVDQPGRLGRLAAAVGAFEDDESAGRLVQPMFLGGIVDHVSGVEGHRIESEAAGGTEEFGRAWT